MDWQQVILEKMAELAEFTVADIAEATGANSSTVRTVLRRNEELVERTGVLGADRRGGRWIRYQLSPSARATIQRVAPPEPPAPNTVLSAIALLVGTVPDAATREDRELALQRAADLLADGREDIAADSSQLAYHKVGRELLSLGWAEANPEPVIAAARWAAIDGQVRGLLPELDPSLAEAVIARLVNSPVAAKPAQEQSDIATLEALAALFDAFARFSMPRAKPAAAIEFASPLGFGLNGPVRGIAAAQFGKKSAAIDAMSASANPYDAWASNAFATMHYNASLAKFYADPIHARYGMGNRLPTFGCPKYSAEVFDASSKPSGKVDAWPVSDFGDGWGKVT